MENLIIVRRGAGRERAHVTATNAGAVATGADDDNGTSSL